jgi:hypothetical protein
MDDGSGTGGKRQWILSGQLCCGLAALRLGVEFLPNCSGLGFGLWTSDFRLQ